MFFCWIYRLENKYVYAIKLILNKYNIYYIALYTTKGVVFLWEVTQQKKSEMWQS